MKNFKKQIEKKKTEIQKIFELKKPIFLFGYNEITIYFFQKKISENCIVEKKFINKLSGSCILNGLSFKNIEKIPPNSIIINCIAGIKVSEVNLKLSKLGHQIYSWIELKNSLDLRDFNYWYLVNFDKFFFKNKFKFIDTFKKLSDFRSKKEYLKILSYKVSGNEKSLMFETKNSNNQYFPDFIKTDKNSTIIDVGAYNGDTISNFLSKRRDFKNIFAFEPDKFNFEKLKQNFGNNNKIFTYNYALGSVNKLVNFRSSSNTSKIDKNGNNKIRVKSLDSLNLKPNFIKVDIEGGEKDFILGSKNTLKKYKPQLAICVYHKSEDFFFLVDIILRINNKYRLYFRHHSLGFTESVMYFI